MVYDVKGGRSGRDSISELTERLRAPARRALGEEPIPRSKRFSSHSGPRVKMGAA